MPEEIEAVSDTSTLPRYGCPMRRGKARQEANSFGEAQTAPSQFGAGLAEDFAARNRLGGFRSAADFPCFHGYFAARTGPIPKSAGRGSGNVRATWRILGPGAPESAC